MQTYNLAKIIFNEILFGGPETEVVYSDKLVRQTFTTKAKTIEVKSLNLSPDDIVVVTGGARGITAQCIIKLSQLNPCRFLLLGRSPQLQETHTKSLKSEKELKDYFIQNFKNLSPREIQKRISEIIHSREIDTTISELRKNGSHVIYECIDCSQLLELKLALEKARKLWSHPISAIIHGAGVLHDRYLGEIPIEQYRKVFNTKVLSALYLLSETKLDPLKYICFFSSVAARWGNRGQSAYGIANEVLNKLALYELQERPQCTIKSIAWGPWQGGMVDENLQKEFIRKNIGLLDLQTGTESFVAELSSSDNIEVVIAQKPTLPLSHFKKNQAFLVNFHLAINEFLLEDHKIQNVKVIPFAAIIEWAQRLARSQRPDLEIDRIENSFCYKGIQIPQTLDQNEITVQTLVEKNESDSASFHISFSMKERIYYKLKIMMTAIKSKIVPPQFDFHNSEWKSFTYDGTVLFHGPSYRTLERIKFNARNEILASLTLEHSKLSKRMLLIDSGIQAAVFWMWKFSNGASLPSEVKTIRFFEKEIPEHIEVNLKGELRNPFSGFLDIFFKSQSGEIIASIEGLVMTRYLLKNFPKDHNVSLVH